MPRARTGPKPRTNPSGSIVFTEQIDLGPDPETGKRRVRRVSAPTLEECAVLAAQVRLLVAQGRVDGPARGGKPAKPVLTLGGAVTRYLDDLAQTAGRPGRVRESTVANYRDKVASHLIGRKAPISPLPTVPLIDVTPTAIRTHYTALSRAGVAPSSVSVLHSVLHAVIERAIEQGDLTVSPLRSVHKPRVDRAPHAVWRPDEAARFRQVVTEAVLRPPRTIRDRPMHSDRWRGFAAAFLVMLATGIRIGEAVALRWSDVVDGPDEPAPVLRIRRTVSLNAAGQPIETATKTRAGQRDIPLTPTTRALLTHLRVNQASRRTSAGRLWQGAADPGKDVVFDTGAGRPLDRAVASPVFRQVCAFAKVPYIKPHGIRHTCGTHLVAAGISPKAVSLLLGHASVTITLQLYAHPQADELRMAAEKLADLGL